jgi:hypothetical protein
LWIAQATRARNVALRLLHLGEAPGNQGQDQIVARLTEEYLADAEQLFELTRVLIEEESFARTP